MKANKKLIPPSRSYLCLKLELIPSFQFVLDSPSVLIFHDPTPRSSSLLPIPTLWKITPLRRTIPSAYGDPESKQAWLGIIEHDAAYQKINVFLTAHCLWFSRYGGLMLRISSHFLVYWTVLVVFGGEPFH